VDHGREAFYCRLEGRLNRPAVTKLRRQLTGSDATRVVLDVSHVEILEDAVLAFLTTTLSAVIRRHGKTVTLRGLRQHQLRVLILLGVALDEDGAIRPPLQRRSA
jgi:anti-anti-sigma regulatory factor